MPKNLRFPLQGALERLAEFKRIKLVRMTPQQLIGSKIELDEYVRSKVEDELKPDENTHPSIPPLILSGRNKQISLSYLGRTIGLPLGKNDSLIYHPEGLVLVENADRSLILEACRYIIWCSLEDRMLLRILPRALKKENEGIGFYDVNLDLTPANLRHAIKLMRELF